MPGLATAAVAVTVGAGARHEAADKGGLAHFLEHMTFKGARGMNARALAEAVENRGGQINASTGYERTTYSVRCLEQDAGDMLDHVLSLALDADLPESEMALEKGVVLQEIGEAADEPDDLVFELIQQAAWPEHPLGRPILGLPDSVRALERSDLSAFIDAHYAADRTVVSVAGAFDAIDIADRASKRLEGLRLRPRPIMTPPKMVSAHAQDIKDLEQTLTILSRPGPGNCAPERFASRLMVEIMGGGMASRLFQEVRETRGLAYAIDAYSDAYSDAGRIDVFYGCDPADVSEVAEVTKGIWEDLAAKGPTEEELARSKAVQRAQLAMAFETPGARAGYGAHELLAFDRLIPIGEAMDQIDAVSVEDVRKVADMSANGPSATARVGPKAGMKVARIFN